MSTPLKNNLTTAINSTSTGSLSLDVALGTRGFTWGRLVELSGDAGVGKSTLALNSIHDCQLNGGIGAYIDAEHAMDIGYVKALGIDLHNLVFSQPLNSEHVFEMVLKLIGIANVIVVDSIAALAPSDKGSSNYGVILSGGFARIRERLKGTETTVIFINQLRNKCNPVTGHYESVSIGGQPVNNFMATRVRLFYGSGIIDHEGALVGHHCNMRVLKHKDGQSGGYATTPILYRKGVANSYETLKLGLRSGVIRRTSTGLFINGRIIGANGSEAKFMLDKEPFLRSSINSELLVEGLNGKPATGLLSLS